jgi:hypothetical protein
MKRCRFQLYEQGALVGGGAVIESSGGVVYVAQNGSASKQAITDVNGTALTNPRALTNGSCEFYVPDTVSKVDLYIQCPDGEFLVARDAQVEKIDDLYVDKQTRQQLYVIPLDQADKAGDATETNTGFDVPVNSLVLPHPAVRVTAIDATETIDVGLLSSETAGDADGFLQALSVGTLGLFQGLILNGGNTMGALFERQDSANAGDLVPAAHAVTGANATSITWTPSAGTDTFKGFVYLPVLLCN